MSAPTRKRRNGPSKTRTASTATTAAVNKSNAPGAAEVELMRGIVDKVDRGLWQDLMNGHFRLAMRCDICGRWLTAHTSKVAGRGAHCAAKAGK